MKDLERKLAEAREPDLDRDFATMEAAVLSTLASCANDNGDPRKTSILGELHDDDFTRQDRRFIFQAVKALTYSGEGVDAVTVRGWASTNDKALKEEEVAAVFAGGNALDLPVLESYVRRLRDRGRLQAARSTVNNLSSALSDPSADVEAVASKIQELAFSMAGDRRLVRDTPNEAEAVHRLVNELESRGRDDGRDWYGLDMGFEQLNRVAGGLGQALVIIGGPPSCGKTTFVKQIADQVADKNEAPVLFFTFEQSADELRIKSLARMAGLDVRTIETGKYVADAGQCQKVGQAIARYQALGRRMRVIDAERTTTVDSIRLQAMAAKARAKSDRVLVVIDYVQIIPAVDPLTGKGFPSLREKTDFVCSELRRLARDLDSPVVAISSLSRAGYAAKSMDAFKESGGLEYGADLAILLKTTAGDGGGRDITAKIVKNRGGLVGKQQLRFTPSMAHFAEKGVFQEGDYMDNIGQGGRDTE
jgi:replicative DNA helicase